MRYGYYPGCSVGSTARPYDLSTNAIADSLGIELDEIEDWNCCGATEYTAIYKTTAYALVGRNLALAAGQDGIDQVVTPCSACFLNLKKTDHYMGKYEEIAELTNEALAAGGLSYKPGSLRVRHLLDVVVNDVGYEAIAEKVVRPLKGLRLAPYYGCLIVRPEMDEEPLDNPEYPTHMDKLLTALGAEVVDFPLRANCCGGHMTQISADTAFDLIRRLIHSADECQADAIVTGCPMCQLNLDAYQTQVNRYFNTKYNMPVLYFTQMIGLALGIDPKALGIGQEIVSAKAVLNKIGTEPETPEPAKPRRKKDDKSLPMPRMKVEG